MARFASTVLEMCIASLAATGTAGAQEDNTVALGVDYTGRAAGSEMAHATRGIGLAWRFGHSQTGWGLATGLGWFAADVNRSIGGLTTEIGELHVKPFMAGYGYTHAFRRTAISAELLGGFAFVSFKQMPSAADMYRDRLGASSLAINSSNTLALRPQTNVWIDMSKKVGLNFSVGYALVRPRLTTTTSLGRDSRRVNADNVALSAGIVYKIF